MPMVYNKLFVLMKERGITFYRLKKDRVFGSATMEKIQGKTKPNRENIDTRVLCRLCAYLHVQPGDIMEYVEPAATGDK